MVFTQTVPSKTSFPGRNPNSTRLIAISMAADRAPTTVPSTPQRRRTMSTLEARISLVAARASQASSVSQRLLLELATETANYVFLKQFKARTLEGALMSVPDLETVKFKVLSRRDQYEIREVEPYFIAETTVPGKTGFDFNGASQSFNVLAEYLFGFVTNEEVEQRESKLREALKKDGRFQVKEGTSVEVAQYNPPFTLPFQRRNEISLEVESREQ